MLCTCQRRAGRYFEGITVSSLALAKYLFCLDSTTSNPSLFIFATPTSLRISEYILPDCLLGVLPVLRKNLASLHALSSSCILFHDLSLCRAGFSLVTEFKAKGSRVSVVFSSTKEQTEH